MRKQELIHVHELLVAVRSFLERECSVRVEAPGYEALSVEPSAVYASKRRHETAVFRLAAALGDTRAEQDEGSPAVTAG
ncbi:UPF0058 family protein [Halosegnis sp.]|uniref:UPF0058 family protein n=1 Tax=Halosegnis sp. TaxID=2864959 RepID=UPI0035D5231A